MDLLSSPDGAITKVSTYNQDKIFNDVFYVSATKGKGVVELKVGHTQCLDCYYDLQLICLAQEYLISKAKPEVFFHSTDSVSIFSYVGWPIYQHLADSHFSPQI